MDKWTAAVIQAHAIRTTSPNMTQTVMKNDHSIFLVEVSIKASDWRIKVSDVEALCRTCVIASWHAAEKPIALNIASRAAEASVILTDDKEMAQLNKVFRACRGPTNVLAFPALDNHSPKNIPKGAPVLLGDVVIAFGVTEREAREQSKSLANHLSHRVVHGTLHLLGYDHITKGDTEVMENVEKKVLAGLSISDPYTEKTDLYNLQITE